ncbi:hypothetical protein JTE90_018769 [Oedothorax gibbosus]|uniref:Uncharacterized protein n=1 Tax=Oedothorax gibbosus TaxID=931172 RepID=A0AAV6UTF7_9ARAC|nr:hypothetical protein JTE90_018769 [Oedothorax gibbosus]
MSAHLEFPHPTTHANLILQVSDSTNSESVLKNVKDVWLSFVPTRVDIFSCQGWTEAGRLTGHAAKKGLMPKFLQLWIQRHGGMSCNNHPPIELSFWPNGGALFLQEAPQGRVLRLEGLRSLRTLHIYYVFCGINVPWGYDLEYW